MEDEYAYEEEYPSKLSFRYDAEITHLHCPDDPPPREMITPSLGWDPLIVDHGGGMLGGRRRHPHIERQPVSLPFIMGQRDLNNFSGTSENISHVLRDWHKLLQHYYCLLSLLLD